MDWILSGIRAIIAVPFVFFLPGFAWTLVFFKDISFLERLVLSFALSITLITLSIIIANVVLHVKIDALDSIVTIMIITAIPLAIYYFEKHRRRN